MGEHDARLRHQSLHAPPLRPALHPRPAIPFLHRASEPERVEGRVTDKHPCHVSFFFFSLTIPAARDEMFDCSDVGFGVRNRYD